MGKNRHSKDKLYLTATEWSTEYGGKKTARSTDTRPLPFDHCALNLTPFVNPSLLGTKSGVIFDFENIVPYVQQYKCDPVSGDPVTTKDIIKLTMSKNSEGEWQCPITNKVFTNSSHIVAISTSGNVYSYNAVNELNLKSKNFSDLITGESFRRSDIITLQDPQNLEQLAKRDINNFAHLKTVRKDHSNNQANNTSSTSATSSNKIRHTLSTANILKEIENQKIADQNNGIKRKTLEEIISQKEDENNNDVLRFLNLKPLSQDVTLGQIITDGKAGVSLTSTSTNISTSNASRYATADEIREARWKIMRKLGKKGYAQLQTTTGNLNIELHCEIAPRTSWNFLTLCEQEYYDNMIFHRLVPNFMIQTGDPSGTGREGKSAFGNGIPFKDEFDTRILHNQRGVLSMANSGMNSNGSQFFLLFSPASHLDLKHSVFGRVVGGLNTLDRMEEIGGDKKEKPLQEIKLVKAVVFTNPIPEADDLLEQFIRKNMKERIASSQSRAVSSISYKPTVSSSSSANTATTATSSSSTNNPEHVAKMRKLG